MTKLPEKALLNGTRLPKTTTGEMKNALGDMRDYLCDLFGEDSSDKEAARRALGIDLAKLEAKVDRETVDALKDAIEKKGIPVGTVAYFAMGETPSGYLKADGSAVGRETYPELFAAIGVTYGEGDGETTFHLPDLMGRFAEGSAAPGTVKAAGLPNVEGTLLSHDYEFTSADRFTVNGALHTVNGNTSHYNALAETGGAACMGISFNAGNYNAVFGASDTVQPPALTLLPCIKAFDAVVNPGLVDVTRLAQEIANKADKNDCLPLTGGTLNGNLCLETIIGFNRTHVQEALYVDENEKGIVVRTGTDDSSQHFYHFTRDGHIRVDGMTLTHVVTTYDDGTNWWRRWSDGWLEQGGLITGNGVYGTVQLTFPVPFSRTVKTVSSSLVWGETWYTGTFGVGGRESTDIVGMACSITLTGCRFQSFSSRNWYACGY